LDSQGQVAVEQAFTPGGAYTPAQWHPGETLRDQVDVRLPAALETGTYTWALAVDGAPPVPVGSLAITAPERLLSPPPVNTVLDADLGPLTLHGFSLSAGSHPRGADLPLTLAWQANQLMPDSYHVFVHLVAPDGSLAAQSDGVPAQWARPTTGWLPGEYVMDERALFIRPDLEPGTYTLWAGMYAAATGERLGTEAFEDGRVEVGTVVVE
jgi:hypothetical protein